MENINMSAFKINPFNPNGPVSPGMFVGRLNELKKLESTLVQTGAGLPVNFMLTGERGIGKTSFLNYIKWVADGSIPLDDQKFNFLVIETDIDQNTTQVGLVKKIELGLKRALGKTEKARTFFKNAWDFIQKIEAAGYGLKDNVVHDETFLEEFSYSLADTVNRVTELTTNEFDLSAKYQGVLLLIDEADKCAKELDLGTFVKLLLERLQRQKCQKFMIGLAGLPDLRNVLNDSHPSSLRIFEQVPLERLSDPDINQVIDIGLEKAKELNGIEINIEEDARKSLIGLSEGYPHFIQQFGYSAFEKDINNVISIDDVSNSAFGPRGALDLIGDRYYRNDFYNKIQKDNYRQVLRIMSDDLDGWVTKRKIKEKFKGKANTLDNAINALKTRHIIIADESERGRYRLQHKGFALWIKLYTKETISIEDIEK